MATVSDIALLDHVELLEPVGHLPAGATGGVLEVRDEGGIALVEFTSMPPEPALDRLESVPVATLRRVDRVS